MHVDNFYNHRLSMKQSPVQTAAQQEKLQHFDSPHLEDSIAGLLPSAADGRVLNKRCIIENIFSRIDYTSRRIEADNMLLPLGLRSTYRLMTSPPSPPQQSEARGTADLRRWRTQTTGLLRYDRIESGVSPRARRLAADLTQALQPWAVSRYGSEARSSHLARLMEEAVELGLEVFGMPGEAKWSCVAKDGMIAVFPGLLLRREQDAEGVADVARRKTGRFEAVEVMPPAYARK